FFFFSSRRRHTRFKCDWSSDVCSSDLVHLVLRRVRDPADLPRRRPRVHDRRSEEHTSELQSHLKLVCRLLLEKTTLAGNVLQRTRGSYVRDPSWTACNKRSPGSGCASFFFLIRRHPPISTLFPYTPLFR